MFRLLITLTENADGATVLVGGTGGTCATAEELQLASAATRTCRAATSVVSAVMRFHAGMRSSTFKTSSSIPMAAHGIRQRAFTKDA